MTIKIDDEFKALIPPLSVDEYQGLEESIIAEGCRDALIVWGDTLVDGHNRYNICTKHNIPYKTKEIIFESKVHARIWIRNNQMSRRNLTDGWKIELGLGNKADLAEIGEKKRKDTEGRPSKEKLLSNIDNSLPKHNTQKILAVDAGVSTGKLAMAEVIRNTDPDVWEEVKAGEKTVGGAYKEIKQEEKKAEIAKRNEELKSKKIDMPDGLYDVIYADPPWQYEHLVDATRDIENQYPTDSINNISSLKIPSAKNAILFLWVPPSLIEHGLMVCKAWGFEYRTHIIWDKEIIGMGYFTRAQHELLFIARKGSINAPIPTDRISSIFREKRKEHSKKPLFFYEYIQKAYPREKYLEVYARDKYNDRWDVYGNQL